MESAAGFQLFLLVNNREHNEYPKHTLLRNDFLEEINVESKNRQLDS